MPREFEPVGIAISGALAKCANRCRFCQLARLRPETYSVERYAKVVEKFIEYREKSGFQMGQWLGYSYDFTLEDYARQMALYDRANNWPLKVLLLGGLPLMTGLELRRWYRERQGLGCDKTVASYYGYGRHHDYLNNQAGHFDWQVQAQKTAAGLGLQNGQRIFLFKSALPEMGRLLDKLEEVDRVTERTGYLLFYSGQGRNFENERLTMAELDAQPERVRAIYRHDKSEWKSERGWVEWVRAGRETFPQNWLTLHLTDENIAQAEALNCEEIIADLTRRTQRAYNAVPGKEELAEKYGDRDSDKVYMFMWDMECLWVDRFLARHPGLCFERHLTHFGR
jgi:hypothetical protein